MLRKCYNCLKELTVFEAMKGQAVLHWVEKQDKDFEGWVHCRGEDSQFVAKEDLELKELCDTMGVRFFDGTPHACNKCMREQASREGIEVPRSVISGEDYIYRCPECRSTKVSIYHQTHTRFHYVDGKKVKEETVDTDSAYLVQCDSTEGKCDHRIDLTNNQGNDDFHDYETEIV